jgi:hypothetical protein
MIIRCGHEPSVFNKGNKIITVYNKTVKINDKKGLNLLKLLNYSNEISNYSQNESYTFFDYYFQVLRRIRFLLRSEISSNIFLWQLLLICLKINIHA